ncbi:hypothetical protein LCGC14_2625890, partial [marine sediment metagenome]
MSDAIGLSLQASKMDRRMRSTMMLGFTPVFDSPDPM